MFKPRLRIPRGAGAPRLSSAVPRPAPLSPFAVTARHQQQQQRSLHASPSRRLHKVAPLTDDAKFEQYGVPGLLTTEGFEFAYTNYQSWLLEKLNQMTAGTSFEGKTTLETLILTAREPHLAATFNYASMAHNNHFFFDGLSKTGGNDKNEHISSHAPLAAMLEMSFGSLESLRRELIMTADAMFGPGFVWMVQQMDSPGAVARPFKLLTTYQAGSPHPGAHWRSQGVDMNNHGGQREGGAVIKEYFDRQNIANNREPLHGSGATASNASKAVKSPPGGSHIVPLLCVNTWEHVWMWDYGIGGKAKFVENWWETINWGKVNDLAHIDEPYKMTANPKISIAPAARRVPGVAAERTAGAPQ
ncbi:superoxide dismutase [Diaporthe amygdali]|uniref:superoxide dismutase n=1 Tax=Phomopsis amygdali TaxID=1214568 RepID=UPI0022FED38F|nr:superoxide dismutase [Diaporthe amygdali]KAJ0121161.1 superoxide dismutase [Diaporthe amygdali]